MPPSPNVETPLKRAAEVPLSVLEAGEEAQKEAWAMLRGVVTTGVRKRFLMGSLDDAVNEGALSALKVCSCLSWFALVSLIQDYFLRSVLVRSQVAQGMVAVLEKIKEEREFVSRREGQLSAAVDEANAIAEKTDRLSAKQGRRLAEARAHVARLEEEKMAFREEAWSIAAYYALKARVEVLERLPAESRGVWSLEVEADRLATNFPAGQPIPGERFFNEGPQGSDAEDDVSSATTHSAPATATATADASFESSHSAKAPADQEEPGEPSA